MRAISVILGVVMLSSKTVAEPLAPADREALLDNLEKLHNTVTERVDARFRLAIAAYRAAMVDEGTAMEFYLKCVQKTNFEDQGKKESEFNDWKKKEHDRMSETSMRRALVHQLRWLVLALRASSENADLAQLGTEGQSAIDAMFTDKVMLATQRQILGQGVTGTVFAKVYDINNVKLEKWPSSPLDVASFYEEFVFPRYRVAGDVENLRASWIKRIQLESELRESAPARPVRPNNNGRGPAAPAPEPPARSQERFVAEVLPDLQWQMEMDLFRCGDQRGAATRMLAHLEKHLTNDKIKTWSDQLKALLTASQAPAPTPDPAATQESTATPAAQIATPKPLPRAYGGGSQ